MRFQPKVGQLTCTAIWWIGPKFISFIMTKTSIMPMLSIVKNYICDEGKDNLDDLYMIGAVCLSDTKKLTPSLICSATVAGEIYI